MDVRSFLQKNREMLIYGSVFVVLVSIGIYFLINQGDEGDETSTYEVPLEQPEGDEFEWGSIAVDSQVESSITVLPTYTVSPVGVTEVMIVVNKLGFTGEGRLTGEGTYRFWGDDDEYARFNTVTKDLVVNSPGIRLTEIEHGVVTSSEIGSYVLEFVQVYLGMDIEIDAEIENERGVFQVDGSWSIGGYDVIHGQGQEYSFRAEFSSGGDLISMYVKLLTIAGTGETVDLVSVDSLNYYLSQRGYPKEAYISSSASAIGDCSYEEDCDPYGLHTIEGFTNVEIDTITIVYYHDALGGSEDLVPVYKLEGDGISADEDELPVRVTIYANAIDPSQVIIPSQE